MSVLAFAGLTALSAQVRVPVPGTDVPMTLQSLAVIVAGLSLSPLAAASAMLLYLVCGLAGFPVFMPGSQGLFGATGGYLVGFLFSAITISLICGPRVAGVARMVIAGLAGLVVLFAFGLAWRLVYARIFGLDANFMIASGLFPFVPKAVVEVLLAVALVRVVRMGRAKSAMGG